jgi:lysyl-tRNA synthetase class II
MVRAVVRDQTGAISVLFDQQVMMYALPSENRLGCAELELLDDGDIVEVKGTVKWSVWDACYLVAISVRVLTKALRPPPADVLDPSTN